MVLHVTPTAGGIAEPRTLRAKQRIVVTILCVLALWPVGQRLLVARYDLNPWKFFGWAMYCRPPATIDLEIRAPGTESAAVTVPADWGRRTARFLYWRKHAGALVRPRRLGRILLELNPGLHEVEIVVTHTRLDSTSARIVSRSFDYRYGQDE